MLMGSTGRNEPCLSLLWFRYTDRGGSRGGGFEVEREMVTRLQDPGG